MSLDYDLGDIKDWKKVCQEEDGAMKPLTHQLIFMCMVVDLTAITDKNIDEWRFRMAFYSRIYGEDRKLPSRDDLVKHIGLRTNVSTLSRAAWMKRHVKAVSEQVERSIHVLDKMANVKIKQ